MRASPSQLVGANPLIGQEEIAERLAVPADDLDQILDHPLSGILRRWQATKPGHGWAAYERK